MAADNAIIIGLIAASFAKADRQRIIMFGVLAAFIFRVIFALITVKLLQYPILKIIGGTILIWIIFKLVQDLQLLDIFKTAKPKIIKPKKQPSFISGVYAVLIADVTLSFDNVLGVAAANTKTSHELHSTLLPTRNEPQPRKQIREPETPLTSVVLDEDCTGAFGKSSSVIVGC